MNDVSSSTKLLRFLERAAAFFTKVGNRVAVPRVLRETWRRYRVVGRHRRVTTEAMYAHSTVTTGTVVQVHRRRTPTSLLRAHIGQRASRRTKESASICPARGIVKRDYVNTLSAYAVAIRERQLLQSARCGTYNPGSSALAAKFICT